MLGTAIAQIASIVFFVLIVFFLINVVDFMKRKSRNDEKMIQTLEKILERLPETKELNHRSGK